MDFLCAKSDPESGRDSDGRRSPYDHVANGHGKVLMVSAFDDHFLLGQKALVDEMHLCLSVVFDYCPDGFNHFIQSSL
jgi:hypothetical protein